MSNTFKEQLVEATFEDDLLLLGVINSIARRNNVTAQHITGYVYDQPRIIMLDDQYVSSDSLWELNAMGEISKDLLLQDEGFKNVLVAFFSKFKKALGSELYQEVAGVEGGVINKSGQSNISAELSSAILTTQGRMLDSLSSSSSYPSSSSSPISSKMSKDDKKEKKKKKKKDKKKKKSLLVADSKYKGMIFNP